jgi:aryl-alcohol dehydrogenase-like predicted oxidoreductase
MPDAQRSLGRTGIEIAPLVFGGNVFGWTVDERTSGALLDRFFDAGLNAIDTADAYSKWAPGNRGGESETLIGRWLKARPGRRKDVVVITKVGSEMGPSRKGLSARHILAAAEDSLRRLQTDYIDVYLSHFPDPDTPMEETLGAYATLLRQGKVRAVGGSNYDAAGLGEALRVSAQKGLPRYEVAQPEYNLYDRASYEGPLRDLCMTEGLGVITYYSLASGFLSGKYRSTADLAKSRRGGGIGKYLDERGQRILAALDSVARDHNAEPAEVALAWLIAREGVTAPIASATSLRQVESLVRATQLALSRRDIAQLDKASAVT